jgi:hypothetical protein
LEGSILTNFQEAKKKESEKGVVCNFLVIKIQFFEERKKTRKEFQSQSRQQHRDPQLFSDAEKMLSPPRQGDQMSLLTNAQNVANPFFVKPNEKLLMYEKSGLKIWATSINGKKAP